MGVDLLLAERSYEFVKPGIDRELLQGVLALSRKTPLVLGQSVDSGGRVRPLFPPLISLTGADRIAMVLVKSDPDGVVREILPEFVFGETARPSLSAAMARQLGATPGAGLIDFTLGPAFGYISLQAVLDLASANDTTRLQQLFAGKTVLIGSALPFSDRHRAPVPLFGGEGTRAPGVLLHAQMLRSFLHNGALQRASPFTVNALAAFALLLLFLRQRPRTGVALLLVLGTALAEG